VYLVAFRNPGEWRYPAAVLSLIDSVRWHSSKGAGKGEGSPTGPQDGVREGRFVWPKSVANTINAQFGSKLGLDNEHCQNAGAPLFVPAVKPIVIDRAAFNQGKNAQYDPQIRESETMDTLVSKGPHAVAQPIPINTMAALRPQGSDQNRQTFGVGQPGDPQFTLQAHHSHAVATGEMAVRRITPVEGERLQGFPDNWSRIPWKGKPEEECPDGPRYKAIGNSMAVPCMAWIGRRIALVEKLIG
jgi:site-specific DNA-cytosine methylase